MSNRPRDWRTLSKWERAAIMNAAGELRDKGWTWNAIAKRFDVSHEAIHYALDPAFREHRRKRIWRSRWKPRPRSPLTADERRALNVAILGDPPPGRSALDMEHAGRG